MSSGKVNPFFDSRPFLSTYEDGKRGDCVPPKIDSALKFKYRPRVANGERLEVSGVRNLIKFELEGG